MSDFSTNDPDSYSESPYILSGDEYEDYWHSILEDEANGD